VLAKTANRAEQLRLVEPVTWYCSRLQG